MQLQKHACGRVNEVHGRRVNEVHGRRVISVGGRVISYGYTVYSRGPEEKSKME